MDRRLEVFRGHTDRALEVAVRLGLDVSIVCVDSGGRLVCALRRDLASWASIEPARRKAITAAAMALPTADVSALMERDPVMLRALAANPEMLAAPGGFPVFLDGACIGGIGIAGASYHDDQAIGEAAFYRSGGGS